MKTLSDFDFSGKAAFVRVDLNCPVDEQTQKVEPSERIAGHALTVRELSGKGAKVVVLAHQGRKGDYDCISLSQHALLLGASVKKPVNAVLGYASMQGPAGTVAELAALGVKRVSVGSVLSRVALGAFFRAAQELREHGTFGFGAQAIPMSEVKDLVAPRTAR